MPDASLNEFIVFTRSANYTVDQMVSRVYYSVVMFLSIEILYAIV